MYLSTLLLLSYLYGHNVFQDNLSLKYDKRTMHRSVENRDGVNGTEIFSSSSNLRILYTGRSVIIAPES